MALNAYGLLWQGFQHVFFVCIWHMCCGEKIVVIKETNGS
jgi:hypothetical protein